MRQLRFATGGAAAGWARVTGVVSPWWICSEDSVLHEMAHNLEREYAVSEVAPGSVDAPGPTPAGLSVVPLSEAGVEAVWSCHESAAADDPSGLTRRIPLDEYAATQWEDPTHRPELGAAVVEGDDVVAYGSVLVAGDRAWNSMTGTRRTHRGQGLATLVKRHSLAALAAAGVRRCFTGNDAENEAMLAVNRALGYRRGATTWGASRRLSANA